MWVRSFYVCCVSLFSNEQVWALITQHKLQCDMREHDSPLELLLLRIYQFVKFQSLLLLRCCFHTVVDYCQRAYDHSESYIVYSRPRAHCHHGDSLSGCVLFFHFSLCKFLLWWRFPTRRKVVEKFSMEIWWVSIDLAIGTNSRLPSSWITIDHFSIRLFQPMWMLFWLLPSNRIYWCRRFRRTSALPATNVR